MTTLSCIIIGQNSLAQLCGEIILSAGHCLCGIISKNKNVQLWAKNNDIALWISVDEWVRLNKPVNYIFSIVNDVILSDIHLRLASRAVINYHDSLLPRYAGVHATSWAIINAEKEHGISWHLIDSGIDTGDVLIQETISINSNETALSLNLKCYQAGANSFKALMKQLIVAKCAREPQNLSQRSYYSQHKKPSNGCIIDWHQSANDIERLFRALSFGPEPNKLGIMKLFTTKCSYQVMDLLCELSPRNASPGQIITLDEVDLRVSAALGNVIIKKLQTLDGNSVTLKQFAEQTNLRVGDCFNHVDEESQAKFTQICEELSPFESYWVSVIIQSQATSLPYLTQTYDENFNCYQNNYSLPDLRLLPKGLSAEVYFITLWSIYLYRLNNYQPGTIGFVHRELTQGLQLFANYFASSVPLTFLFSPELTVAQAYQLTEKTLIQTKNHKTYLRDIFARYPQLEQREDLKQFPCQLIIGPLAGNVTTEAQCVICFDPENAHYRLQLQYCSQEIDYIKQIANQIHAHLMSLLQSSLMNPTLTIVALALLGDEERQQLLGTLPGQG